MISSNQGYPKERFPELKGDSFDCCICTMVCRDPKECVKCGSMFCGPCIDTWLTKHNECPLGCSEARNNINPIAGALIKLYKNLDVKCKFNNCGKVLKLCDLVGHEAICQTPKCDMNEFCNGYVKPQFQIDGVCSAICKLLKQIKYSNGNYQSVYNEIRRLMKEGIFVEAPKPINSMGSSQNLNASFPNTMVIKQGIINNNGGGSIFKWDIGRKGTGIDVSSDGKTAYLKENAYMFRSIIGDTGFYGGVHYWEIVADNRTENELKIGITTKRDFNYDTAFADYEYGFSYYGLGQLRHGSNSLGSGYGKKFKKEGALGMCLDMNKGTLSFGMNGENWGEAYKDDSLKKGPIFAAVALLHQAGCKLESGKAVPSSFLK